MCGTAVQKHNRKFASSPKKRKMSLLGLIIGANPITGDPVGVFAQRGYDSMKGRSAKGTLEEAKQGAIDKVSGGPIRVPARRI